jgi:hypothetical protein
MSKKTDREFLIWVAENLPETAAYIRSSLYERFIRGTLIPHTPEAYEKAVKGMRDGFLPYRGQSKEVSNGDKNTGDSIDH